MSKSSLKMTNKREINQYMENIIKKRDYKAIIDYIDSGADNVDRLLYWGSKLNSRKIMDIANYYGYFPLRCFDIACMEGDYDYAIQMFLRVIEMRIEPYSVAYNGILKLKLNTIGSINIHKFLTAFIETPDYYIFYLSCMNGDLLNIRETYNNYLSFRNSQAILELGLLFAATIYNWDGNNEAEDNKYIMAIIWLNRYLQINNFVRIFNTDLLLLERKKKYYDMLNEQKEKEMENTSMRMAEYVLA